MIELRAIESLYGEGILRDMSRNREASEARAIVVHDWTKNRKGTLKDLPSEWGMSYGSAYYGAGRAAHMMRRDLRFRDAYARYVEAKACMLYPDVFRKNNSAVAGLSAA